MTVTVDSWENPEIYPTQVNSPTNTIFTIPKDATLLIQAKSGNPTSSNWNIVNLAAPGNAGNVVFRAATSASYTDNGLTGGVSLANPPSWPNLVSMLFTNQAATINPQGYYNPTNGRWTPTVAGYYEVNFRYMFRNNSNTGTSGYVAIYKNGTFYAGAFDDTASFCCPEIGSLVYMNGTTDYLQVAANVNTGTSTLLNCDGAQEWDIALVNQQVIANTNTGNYRVPAAINSTIPALLLANVPPITDTVGNIYVITNTSSSAITLTAGNYTGYQLFPMFFTSGTSVTMPAGSVLELMSITPGSDYQVVTMSQPTVNGAVAFGGYCNFNAPANAQTTVTNYITNYNPQNYFNPTTGRFTPKTAGYYQINCVATGQAGGLVGAAIIKNGSITASPWCYNDTGGGNFSSATPSCVVYMNGTTDYLEIRVAPGTTGKIILTVFDGYLTCQTNTQVVGTTAAARASLAASQAVPQNVVTKVALAAAQYDPLSWFVPASNRFVPNIPGYYQLNAAAVWQLTTEFNRSISIRKNGVAISVSDTFTAGGTMQISDIVYMNGTTDYLEIYVFQASAAAVNLEPNNAYTFFDVSLVGANQAVPAVKDTTAVSIIGPAATPGNNADYCVIQLDNLKVWFRQIGGANFMASTVTGSDTYLIDYDVILWGGGAGWNTYPNASSGTATLTTTATNMANSGNAGRFVFIFREVGGAGRVYRATYTINFSYIRSSILLERVVS